MEQEKRAGAKERAEASAAASIKYEAVLDWEHYAPLPKAQQQRLTSFSVGEMYWRTVAPIRDQVGHAL